ncbi:FAD-binding oxidoreductase [uncultured Roseobacter sp.]|uniref:FAD-binding oxidoreductase n=1 Tax=uncultured Roseobacter sp. TaxID=114847 RepID=UPI0026154AFE|nr:FAD-binding oxidoreductase [uncultured Roseobacter sp.]
MAPDDHSGLSFALGDIAIFPGCDAYDARRTVWNETVDRCPAAICACRTPQDVQQVVSHMSQRGGPVSVRGGGHNIAGTAVADDVVMIDLSDMRQVTVDAEARRVRVAGGATFADVDAATQKHGLAVAGGVVSSTGVGGLTLGGGIGWLARRHGLSIDNLLSAEVVLPGGQRITVSDQEHSDLFWALRGGGGNFGVVTAFEFRAHPVGPNVSFGPTFFDLDCAEAVLTAYAQQSQHLPNEACVWANLMTAPPSPALPTRWHGKKVLTLMQFHAGPLDAARTDLAPLYGGVKPLGSAFAERPFIEAQRFLDDAYAFGARNYWRTHNHTKLTLGLISTLVDLAADLPTRASELLICQLGGAIQDVPADATAFAHRHVQFVSTPGVRWQDAGQDAQMIAWLRRASERIAEHADPGAYVNFIAEQSGADIAYQHHMERLRGIKRRYDPNNMFRINQNIRPAAPP